MTRVTLSSADPAAATCDALVIGLYSGGDSAATPRRGGTSGGANGGARPPVAADPTFAAAAAACALAGAGGGAGTVTTVPASALVAADRIIGVGLGPRPDGDDDAPGTIADRVRAAAGVASRSAAGRARIVSTLAAIDLPAAAEGHLLGAYQFATYKQPKDAAVGTVVLAVKKADKAAKSDVARAEIVADAVAFARDLVNSAPNELYPASFADRAAAAARALGLSVQVLDEKALARGGYGGILAVGSGSTRPPRLVRIAYAPNRSGHPTVTLVGKGITFDSGGISIKPGPKMDQMTGDMSGAAAVVAAVLGAARLHLPIAVVAYAALAENLPSGSSYRPGDVIRHYGGSGKRGAARPAGKTSHILNTDAEGRLVLADAIVRACEDDPDFLLEASTLTGAQVVALGKRTMGVMGEPALRDRVAELAREVGEGGWAMPLPEHLREGLDSPLADLQNIAGEPGGGMLVAGHYLAAFVPDGLPWAHLDVAGPAFHDGKPYGYTATGGTGVPVRTLLAVLQDLGSRPRG